MDFIQIGIIGSMADQKLSKTVIRQAIEVGQELAKNKINLAFGYEGDFESVSSIAAETAEKNGGKTIAFIWGNKKQNLQRLNSIQVVTKQPRGGGREFTFILSCDAIICLSGGSGTLMEIAMAYQANIPVVALKNSGGWSGKLAGKFLDNRRRLKIIAATSGKEAVDIAIKEAKNKIEIGNLSD